MTTRQVQRPVAARSASLSVANLSELSSSQAEPSVASNATLRRSALRGSVWTLLGYAGSQALRLGSNLVLTRLLVPEAFGVMVLVNTFLQGLQMFSDIGIGPSIIQNSNGVNPQFRNTAWTIQVIRGCLLSVVACALAWPIAVLYKQPQIVPLVMVSSLTAMIAGFGSTSLYALNRELRLGRLTLLDIGSQAAGIAIMIVWAWTYPSAWALVGGAVATSAVRVLFSHALDQHRDRFAWDPEARKALLAFGRTIGLSTAVTFLASQGERIILGRWVSLETLGVYSVGLMIATLGTSLMQVVMSRVLFPSLAKLLRTNRERAMSHYARLNVIVAAMAAAVTLGLVVVGPSLVHTLYDPRYSDAGWILQILAVQAFLDISLGPASWLLLAAGQPRFGVYAGLSRVIILCGVLPLSLAYSDLQTVIWVIALSSAPARAIYIYGVARTFPKSLSGELLAASISSVAVAAGILLFR